MQVYASDIGKKVDKLILKNFEVFFFSVTQLFSGLKKYYQAQAIQDTTTHVLRTENACFFIRFENQKSYLAFSLPAVNVQ